MMCQFFIKADFCVKSVLTVKGKMYYNGSENMRCIPSKNQGTAAGGN